MPVDSFTLALAGRGTLASPVHRILRIGAISFVNATTSTNGTISRPSGVQDGDLLVLGCGDLSTSATFSVSGGGWVAQNATHSGNESLEVFSKIASGEPASYSITGGTIRYAWIVAYRGASSATVDATGASSSTATAPSLTPTQSNDLEIYAEAARGSPSNSFTPTTGWNQRVAINNGGGTTTGAAYVQDRLDWGTTNATGTVTPGGSAGNTPCCIHLLFKSQQAVFRGTSSLSAIVRGYRLIPLTLAGQGTLSLTGFSRHFGAVSLRGTSSLSARVHRRLDVTLAGTSSLSATPHRRRGVTPTFAGTSSLTTHVYSAFSLSLSGTSSLSATTSTYHRIALTLHGTSSLSTTVSVSGSTVVNFTVTLAGVGHLSATLSGVHRDFTLTLAGTSHLRIFSVFDSTATGVGAGNGGEVFGLRLAGNGASETATLDGAIGSGNLVLGLTGDSGLPSGHGFVVTIDSEVLYLLPRGGGEYVARGRGLSNTTPASHSDGSSVVWDDSYDMAIRAGSDIAHEFTADINSTGSFTYPGWLIGFDSSQAYLAGDRYPMHVTSVLGVFDAGAGSGGTNRCDAAQPNAVCTPAAVSDDCPAALSNPSRIASDISTGDVALVRYTNPEAVVLDLGPRSAALQSWFGLMRVDATNTDVTFTDSTGYIVDSIPPSVFTGSINGEWGNPIPLLIGIDPASSEDAGHAVPTAQPVPWTTVTLPGTERYFTYGPPHYSRKGWPMCCLSVRQNNRRIPYWQSWDWRDYNFVYTGFGPDYTYAQLLINRNGVIHDLAEVALPGPQDIDGPDVVWDDPTYFVGASWYVVIFNTPYIVFGPGIGGAPGGGSTSGSGGFSPGVTFPVGGGPPIISVPPIEGGAGGGISPPVGGGLRARVRWPVRAKDGENPTPFPPAPRAFAVTLGGSSTFSSGETVVAVATLAGTSTFQPLVGNLGDLFIQPTFAGRSTLSENPSGVTRNITLTLHGS